MPTHQNNKQQPVVSSKIFKKAQPPKVSELSASGPTPLALKMSAGEALDLQRKAGNRAVTQHLSGSGQGPRLQLKGATPLMTSLQPHLAWVGRKIGEAMGGYDPHLKPLFEKINNYDRSTDGRPAKQLEMLLAMFPHLEAWILAQPLPLAEGDIEKFNAVRRIIESERVLVAAQAQRLERFTDNPDSPYEQMTTEGLMWSHAGFEHNTTALNKTGKAYFEEMSKMNLRAMSQEAKQTEVVTEQWFQGFVARAAKALRGSRVNHYTTKLRADGMTRDGMKSKMVLEKENANFKHNTSAYDDEGLANSGFVFFFIEAPNAPFRATRFAQGDGDAVRPARISMPIEASGLLDRGWVMLSDFAQREYPTIMTNATNNAHRSHLPTRPEATPGFTNQARHFEQGGGGLTEEDINAMMAETNPSRRQALSAITTQVRGDAESHQTYQGPVGEPLQIPDRIFQNILVGPDIITGLATRAALEVARMGSRNPTLAATFKDLDGPELLRFMLKDLFRPQAMIPNTVTIDSQHVEVG